MVRCYDIASGEPVSDSSATPLEAADTFWAVPQLRLETVQEAAENPTYGLMTMPADLLTVDVTAFLAKQ